MTRHCCLAAIVAASTLGLGSALAAPQVAPQASPATTADPSIVPDVEVTVAIEETPDQTAYLDQVVCQRIGRAASRLPSRQRVCDTRRAWRDMEEEAVRETQRLLTMNAYNNRPRDPGR
ncbi:hypothetical protein [uncultured Brevundimonas sp.]|uniref:hypothetical protein n=1 Tax=uncultured Brevundimonas sp. TaxID=213418 RepID=UPI0030EDBDE7|tara:strand:- start:2085 stop:2441 length:357 start_codon:yes stop_codon:yes gene_type:complete